MFNCSYVYPSPYQYIVQYIPGVKCALCILNYHRLNMELYRSPKLIWAPCAQVQYTQWMKPATPPHPSAFGLIYKGAIGQAKIDDISL
jgi:hypothetical protein